MHLAVYSPGPVCSFAIRVLKSTVFVYDDMLRDTVKYVNHYCHMILLLLLLLRAFIKRKIA